MSEKLPLNNSFRMFDKFPVFVIELRHRFCFLPRRLAKRVHFFSQLDRNIDQKDRVSCGEPHNAPPEKFFGGSKSLADSYYSQSVIYLDDRFQIEIVLLHQSASRLGPDQTSQPSLQHEGIPPPIGAGISDKRGLYGLPAQDGIETPMDFHAKIFLKGKEQDDSL